MFSHATSYRKSHSVYLSIHFETLNDVFDLSWKRAPAYTTIRNIIKGLSPEEAEKAVRTTTQQMTSAPADGVRFLSCVRVNNVTNICKELYENSLKFERLFRYPELGLEN